MAFLETKNRKIKIFIGSVFFDNGKNWKLELRKKLAEKIRELNHETWLWEENGVIEAANMWKDWRQIVSEAIRTHDLIITFYKTNAGDYSYKHEMPFFPTDFEIAESIKHGTPLRLYLIKGNPNDDLKGVKALYTNPIIIGSKPRYCFDEIDFINKVLQDIKQFSSNEIQISRSSFKLIPVELEKIEDSLNDLHTIIHGQLIFSDYKTAYWLLREHQDLVNIIPKTKTQKIFMAQCLGDFANIYANRAMFLDAIKSASKCVRLYMECGEWHKMFSQVQALSGIQNMAGIKSAYWLNSYGYRTINLYKDLATAYSDSKASILRDRKNYDEAFKLFTEDELEKSPYSAAKYAYLLGLTNKKKNISRARHLMLDSILPQARKENHDLAYVLNESAILAIEDCDFRSATDFLDEAQKICNTLGIIHINNKILRIRHHYHLDYDYMSD